MSIFVKAVQRRNPQKPDAPLKWYPVQKSTGMVEETEVAEMIAEETTLNPSEALMAMRQLRKVVQRLLLNGHSVRLGNWGSYSVTLRTSGEEKRDDLSARNILQVNINFQAGADLKADMQKASFTWIDKPTKNSGGDTPPAGS